MRKFKQQFLAGPYLIWIIGFILLPLIMILYYAFTNGDGSFTLSYITAIADETNRKAMGLSLRLGIICTIVCLVLSYPLAMILNNRKIKNQGLVVFIFMLPMWMNFMLRILAWKLLLSKNGVINSILTGFGLSRINIINTPTAVVLGMVYDFLPFMLLPIYNSMTRIRKDWIEAARDLGAGNVTIFLKIILPLTVSGIISGIVMVFVLVCNLAGIRRWSCSFNRKCDRTGFYAGYAMECRKRSFLCSYDFCDCKYDYCKYI